MIGELHETRDGIITRHGKAFTVVRGIFLLMKESHKGIGDLSPFTKRSRERIIKHKEESVFSGGRNGVIEKLLYFGEPIRVMRDGSPGHNAVEVIEML